jgi:hypothetical protein
LELLVITYPKSSIVKSIKNYLIPLESIIYINKDIGTQRASLRAQRTGEQGNSSKKDQVPGLRPLLQNQPKWRTKE